MKIKFITAHDSQGFLITIVPTNSSKIRHRKNTKLLLTNCEFHTGKYSDRSLDVRTEGSEGPYEKLRSNIFLYGPNQLVNKSFIV